MSKSNIFIISGPSGAGEDSVITGLKDYFPLEKILTTTTREMREGETNGVQYWFISKEEFITRRDKGEFIEWAEQYNGNLYGVTVQEVDRVRSAGKIGIWKIEYKGVMTVKEKFPEIKSIYIAPPSLEILKQRIMKRDKVSEEFINERMEYTKEWMQHENIYDFKVVNEEGKLDEAVKKVVDIIENNTDAKLN